MSFVLCGIIVFLLVMHHFERRDLYNRIMSKDYHDYKGDNFKRSVSKYDLWRKEWRKKESEK